MIGRLSIGAFVENLKEKVGTIVRFVEEKFEVTD